MHRLRLIFVFMLFIVLSLVAIPTYAASITVTSLDNTTTVDSVCTLAEAIENANNDAVTHADCDAGSGDDTLTFNIGSSVNLTSAAFATSTTFNGTQAYYPDITSNITIQDTGLTTINFLGVGNVRIFNISATGNLTLDNLTIENSTINPDEDSYGAGMYVNGGTLTFTDGNYSAFRNSPNTENVYSVQAHFAYGGVVYAAANSIINMNGGVVFDNNRAEGADNLGVYGGDAYGGVLYASSGVAVTVDGATFTTNQRGKW